ncbi:MAG TPA: VCBS repeat-containing protein [Ohtaekwangia sp.]|uniref:VCBS repeat-containing protein n=1 Tax=Ohtaekwangia sp. TaxID=2066019 RepID=UPI002F926505
MQWSQLRYFILTTAIYSSIAWLLTACNTPTTPGGFVQLDPSETGISFANTLEETPVRNIMTYEYMYNGGGVAAGDLNNDGLIDLIFTGNTVSNKVYLNKGQWRFEDITEKAGLAGRPHWKTGVTLADVNADGKLDIYLCYSGPGTDQERCNELYINNGEAVPTFTEQAAAYGLDACGTFSTQASFFDYDRDGDLDMFLLNHARLTYNPFFNSRKLRAMRHPQYGNRLYRNDQGKYTDVSVVAGIHGSGVNFGLGVSVSDIDLDGWPDLYVSNDYEEQDFLYLNNHDGTFRETLRKSFRHIARNGMGTDIADYNNDGLPDVMVVDMLPEDNYRQKILKGPDDYDRYNLLRDSGYHHQNMRNVLQLNLGIGPDSVPVFSEIGQLAGVSNTDWSWSPLFADFDNDGWKDLFITNGFLRDFTNLDFVKYSYEANQKKNRAQGGAQEPYELVKQLPSTKLQHYIFRNNHDLTFTNATQSWNLAEKSVANGAIYADLDNDGDLDIVTNNINQPASVYRNDIAGKNDHYIKIRLQGSAQNTFAIGAKVKISTKDHEQVQELVMTRGFQSAVPAEIIFGTGSDTTIAEIQVTWPDGITTLLTDVKSDTVFPIHYKPYVSTGTSYISGAKKWFEDVAARSRIAYRHKENDFIDYKIQYIVPYQLSKYGPCIALADVNKDGEDDFYIGGASGQSGKLYIAKQGTFTEHKTQPWAADSLQEDTGSLFFDADGDNDADLYVVSGGVEFPPAWAPLLQDRLYLNDGTGKFTKAENILPSDIANGSCAAASDFDKDGDLDLFVGGRSVPGNYPLPSLSYLLRNETKNGIVKFTRVTPEALQKPGMVTSALWTDYNHDTWPDLMIAGEFMPVMLFENQQGKLVDKTHEAGLEHTEGLWCKLYEADMDNDGDPDVIAGNAGLNLPFKASVTEPLTIHAGDFNGDGRIDPIMSYYIQGKQYPYSSRDEMLEQLPALKRKFITYESYAKATLVDILTDEQRASAKVLSVYTTASCILNNNGHGKFTCTALPVEAQFSMISAIAFEDFNHDGIKDILVAGNFYPYRVQWGRNDASSGLVLQGTVSGKYIPQLYRQTGFYAVGDIRSMALLKSANQRLVLLGRNDDTPLLFKCVP